MPNGQLDDFKVHRKTIMPFFSLDKWEHPNLPQDWWVPFHWPWKWNDLYEWRGGDIISLNSNTSTLDKDQFSRGLAQPTSSTHHLFWAPETMAKCTTAPGVLGLTLQRASVRSLSSCHQRVEALRKSSRALAGEACEVPQLGASTEKKGFGESITSHEWLGYTMVYYIYSKDLQGTQTDQRGHQNCDEPPSIPTKNPTHPPERQSDARVKSRSKPLATKPPARPFQALFPRVSLR